MNTSLVGDEIINLLSFLTGQKLNREDVTPPLVFLANLVLVLLGIIFLDGAVAESEKQRLLTILYRFSVAGSNTRRLTHLIIKNVQEKQLYRELDRFNLLIAPLNPSEKLLLVGFCCEISFSDGEIDVQEQKFLKFAVQHLGLNPQHCQVLVDTLTRHSQSNAVALNEVRSLLDPIHFQEVDLVFVQAAKDLAGILPLKVKASSLQPIGVESELPTDGNDLNSFQVKIRQLDKYCQQVSQIVADCISQSFLPKTFAQDIANISEKNRSPRFRLAIIGEFSQGKSTLINALVEEEIQPVREIPCSSTITVLKCGARKRLLCRYKDGREEEIAWSNYWNKASLSETAAIAGLSDELANSSIDEIVFEHPNLKLCRNGVEILDSPGLNEHPERTAITRKLLKDADAAIFVTNSSRPLTQSERELLHEVKFLLNRGNLNEPALNLFVVGNFIDLVTTDKGREQVKQRIHALALQQNSIVSDENRIHLISARAAFNAICEGNRNEYLLAFTKFSQSIETFLVHERGSLQLKRSVDFINDFVSNIAERLKQADDILRNKLQISEAKKQEILELIGEVSGRDTKIRLMVSNAKELAVKESLTSWQKWSIGLCDRLESKSHSWQSSHDAAWSKDKLIRDYTECFIKDLSNDIDNWANKEIKSNILKHSLISLDSKIEHELAALQYRFETLDLPFSVSSMPGIQLTIDSFLKGTKEFDWIEGGLTLGSILAAGLLFVPGGIVIRVILAGLGGFIGGSIRSGMANHEIKKKALKLGLEKLDKSIAIVPIKLREIVESTFDSRVESASSVIELAISSYTNLIEQQDTKHQATTVEIEAYKALITDKLTDLDSIKRNIAVFITSS